MTNERNSEFIPNLSIAYLPSQQEILVNVSDRLRTPFPILQTNNPVFLFDQLKSSPKKKNSGPFGKPLISSMKLKVWDGLSLLNEGELPKTDWTLSTEGK